MNIGIYDTEHFETAATLIRILESQGHVVKLMGPPGLINEIKEERLSTDIFVLPPSLFNFLSIAGICRKEKVEVLILNTVSYHHLLISGLKKLLPKVRIILTVHDTAEFLNPVSSKGFKSKIQSLGKKALKKEAEAYLVLLSGMKKELSTLEKPVFVLPGRLHKFPGLRSTSLLKIVIPGSVDQKRRDYNQLDSLLSIISNSQTRISIELLGAPSSPADKAYLKKLQSRQNNLITITGYTEHIPTRKYDHSLSQATLLWAPLKKDFGGAEIYGKTKASGAFFDAVALGKPLLLPSYIPVPAEIEDLVIQYRSAEELFETIRESREDNFDAIRQRAITAATRFTPERYASTVKELLQDES